MSLPFKDSVKMHPVQVAAGRQSPVFRPLLLDFHFGVQPTACAFGFIRGLVNFQNPAKSLQNPIATGRGERHIAAVKILVNCGLPFALAHGGQAIQIQRTIAALGEIGVTAEPLCWWAAPDAQLLSNDCLKQDAGTLKSCGRNKTRDLEPIFMMP